MPAVGSFVMGAFAAFIMWTLVRALRNGIIFSDGIGYDINEQPMVFASMAAVHGIGALLFAWLAAGHHITGSFPLMLPH